MTGEQLALLTKVAHALLEDGAWVPVQTYLQMFATESYEAVQSRRSKGMWRDGVESKFVKGGGLWINLLAVNRWVAKSELRLVSASGSIKRASRKASASPSTSEGASARNPS